MRKRVGLLVPAGNTTFEPDFHSILPPGVTLHATRIYSREVHPCESEAKFDAVNACVPEAAQALARAQPAVIAYGITSGSFYRGLAYAEQLQKSIATHGQAQAVVPSLAIPEALHALGARSISVVTPYPEWNNTVLRRFLEQTPFRILNLVGDERPLEQIQGDWLWDQPPSAIVDFARKRCHRDADVLLCPCTAWRSFEVVDELEAAVGKPVVTANQATIWKTFHLIGQPIAAGRGGALFRQQPGDRGRS